MTRSSLAVALAAAALLTGCGGGGPPEGPDVERARQQATAELAALVEEVARGLPRYGDAAQDSCASGQRNLTVRDDFRFRCGTGRALVAGLGTDPAAMLTAVDRRAAAACPGWPGGLPADGPEQQALARGVAGAVVLRSASCGQVALELRVVRAGDDAVTAGLRFLPPTPDGTRVSGAPLDVPAALAKSVAAAEQRVLVVSAVLPYAEVPA